MNQKQDAQYDEIVLQIVADGEHELLDEQDIFDKNSMMYSAYDMGLSALNGVAVGSDKWNTIHSKDEYGEDWADLYGYDNNIIAFCGKRGQGKTSAMLSFSAYVGQSGRKNIAEKHTQKDTCITEIARRYPRLKDRSFFVLPPIDPTMLRQGDSVVELILAKLLAEITKLWDRPEYGTLRRAEQRSTDSLEEQKYEILQLFQKCRDGLSSERPKQKETAYRTDFEQFLQSVDVFELKKNLHKILEYYFSLHRNNKQRSFLVIQLDDTDMQMDCAYETMEEVRKYLSLPNVVILLATDIEQLRKLVEQHFSRSLSGIVSSGEAGVLATKYIEKLIPTSQTIYLPTMKDMTERGKQLTLTIKREEGGSANIENCGNLENAIFELVYQKTGLAFVRYDSAPHPFLPSSLRGLVHLFHFLDMMEPPKALPERNATGRITAEECDDYIRTVRCRLDNLALFDRYFLNDWCVSHLSSENERVIRDMNDASVSQSIQLAAKHSNSLYDKFCDEEKNYSLINYIELLNYIEEREKQSTSNDKQRFTFAIRTYYSIQLNKFALMDQIDSIIGWKRKLLTAKEGDDSVQDTPFQLTFPRTLSFALGDQAAGMGKLLSEQAKSLEESTDRLGFVEWCFRALNADIPMDASIASDRMEIKNELAYFCCNWDVLNHMSYSSQTRETLQDRDISAGAKCRAVFDEVRQALQAKSAAGPIIRLGELLPTAFSIDLSESNDVAEGAPDVQSFLSESNLIQLKEKVLRLRDDDMKRPDFFSEEKSEMRQEAYRNIEEEIFSYAPTPKLCTRWLIYIQQAKDADTAKRARSSMDCFLRSLNYYIKKNQQEG